MRCPACGAPAPGADVIRRLNHVVCGCGHVIKDRSGPQGDGEGGELKARKAMSSEEMREHLRRLGEIELC